MFKNLLLRNHKGVEAETWHTCLGISLYKSCVFYPFWIRTLVAMATYSSHRLIMGIEEIDNFFCLIGDTMYLDFFLQECLLSSSLRFIRLLSKSVNFDWLSAWQKGSSFVKMFKNLLLRNHKGHEAKT